MIAARPALRSAKLQRCAASAQNLENVPVKTTCLALASVLFCIVLLGSSPSASAQPAPGVVRGQVVSAADSRPVEHAQVTLDAVPANGNPEYKTTTDPFGFFTLTNVAAQKYQLGVNQLQYIPYTTNLTVVSGATTNKAIKLNPIDGKVAFDIFFQVWCSQTAANLVGANIQIEYWQPGHNLAGGPDNVVNLTADATGSAVASTMVDGYYRFTISRTGWQTLVYQPQANGNWLILGDKVRINQSAAATVFLDPYLTDLKVTVTGYDPVADKPNQPLQNIVVNITGMSFDTPPAVLVPATSLLTLTDGTATFKNLPPIQWQVDVDAPGYDGTQAFVTPDDFGQLGATNVEITLRETKVKVILSSLYQTNSAVAGAEVQLEGIFDSATDGIKRKLNTKPDPADPANTASALFENLLPGSYYIRVKHGTTITGLPTRNGPLPAGPSSFHVDYELRETYIEAEDDTTEEVALELDPILARVQGRLSAEDEQARVEEEPFEPHQNRVWHRIAQDGIQFIEHQLIKLLDTTNNTFIVDSDPAGHFTILIPPGIFGIKIPDMTDYSGHNIEFADMTAQNALGEGPWPYSDLWPYSTYEDGHHGPGLRFDSGHEYEVDLFLHKHFINLVGQILPKGEPFQSLGLVLSMQPDGSSVQTIPYNHLADVKAQVLATGPTTVRTTVSDGGFYNLYILKNLVPGTYNVTLDSGEYATKPVTVTIAPWGSPGDLPVVAPYSPSYFFPGINHYDQAFTLTPQWAAQGTITINDYDWRMPDQNTPPAYFLDGTSNPQYFRMSTLPGKLFSFNPFTGGIPAPSYTIWRTYGTPGWFSMAGSGSQTFTSYNGGPDANIFPNKAPDVPKSYTLDLHAYSVNDPNLEIPNVTVQFPKSTRPAGGQVAHDDSPTPTGIVNTPQWFYVSSTVRIKDAATRLVRVDVLLRRAMQVKGTLTSATSPASPVPGASVIMRNRYGNPVGQTVSADDGSFSVGNLVPETIYLDVSRRGFIPQRIRLPQPSPTSPDITTNLTIAPVPPPTINNFALNRYGLFLPGVLVSADPSDRLITGPGFERAREYLRVTWKTDTQTKPYSYSLQGTMLADGSQRPDEQFTVEDPVTEVWLVDRRAFKDTPANSPNQQAFASVDPPSAINYVTVMKWLNDIQQAARGGEPYNVIHQMVHLGQKGIDKNRAHGKLNLWEMPSGVFNPRVIAFTENGGVAIKDYQLPAGQKPLQGLNLPSWASAFTQIIGYVAGAGKFKYDVKGKYREGELQIDEASTAFEARIAVDPQAVESDTSLDATLVYKYVMGMELKIGQTNAANGPMMFAPSFLGTTISGLSAEFKVTGKDQKASLTGGESGPVPGLEPGGKDLLNQAAGGAADRLAGVFPEFIEKLGKIEPKFDFKQTAKFGRSEYLDSDWLGNNAISAMSYTIEAQASFDASLRVDITRFATGLPYVGQVVTIANSIPGVEMKVMFVPSIGAGAKLSVERVTSYPRISGTTVSAPVQGAPYDFNGTPTNRTKGELKVFLKAGAGFLLSASYGTARAEGSAGVQLGAPRNSPDSSGVTLKFDQFAWPPLTRITGALSVVAKVALKAWALSYEKQWQWDALPFDFKFGGKSGSAEALHGLSASDPPGFMDLSPLHITYTVINPATAGPYRFLGNSGTLVQNSYRAGSVSTLGGSTPSVLFTTVDPKTGQTTLNLTTRGLNQWNSPQPVATGDAILSVAMARQTDGSFIVAWSEIANEDLGNPYPSSVLKYSISTPDGGFWTSPVILAIEDAALFDLKMVLAGKQAILTWQSTTDGPQHLKETVWSSVFDGTNWGDPVALLPTQTIQSTALAGQADGNALLAVANGQKQLLTLEWNGAWWTTSQAADTVEGPVALSSVPGNHWAIAWESPTNSVLLAVRETDGDKWPAPVTIATNRAMHDLQLASVGSVSDPLYLLAWVEGGDVNSIYYMVTTPQGAPRWPATEVTIESAGSYSQLHIQPLSSGPRVSLVAQYNSGTNTTLIDRIVGLPTAGDCNGNGIPDAVELANGTLDDCNLNGIPDICEIALGLVADVNHNGIPDSCEAPVPDDCNRNGISDAYELSLGIGDVNGNGVLDDCETALVSRSVLLQPDEVSRFYRALNLKVKSQASDSIDVEYIGTLEEATRVDGPWFVVP